MSIKSQNNTTKKLNRLLINTGDIALKRRARRIIEEISPQNNEKILDVGCGDGYYLYILNNLGLKINLVGADFDKAALVSAKRYLNDKKIKLVHCNLMEKTPFENNSFDKIIMSEVAEHLPNDIKGLKEVNRILKPGGILCLTVPNIDYPFLWDPINWFLQRVFKIHINDGFWAGIWNQHLRLYKREQLIDSLKKSGFKVEIVEVQTFWCLPFNHNLLNTGARILSKNPNSSLTKGASKFSNKNKKGTLTSIFFSVSKYVDLLNTFFPMDTTGVTLFVKATKN